MIALTKKFQIEPIEWLFADGDCEKAALQDALFTFGDERLTYKALGLDHWELSDAQTSGRLTGEFGQSGKTIPTNASALLSVVVLRWAMRFRDEIVVCFADGQRLRHTDISAENVAVRHRDVNIDAIENLMLKAGVGKMPSLSGHCKQAFPQKLFVNL